MGSTVWDETAKVKAQTGGDNPAVMQSLIQLVYDDLRVIAANYLRQQRPDHTLQPTALVHEAYLRLADQTNANWTDRAHFMAVAAMAMRQILVNHAERRSAAKRGGKRQRVTLDPSITPAPSTDFDILELHEALKRLAALDPRKARVVEARYFGGLTCEEVACVLGVSRATVENDWRMARAWLASELRDHDSSGAAP